MSITRGIALRSSSRSASRGFRLAVTSAGTQIVQRGGAEVANLAGSCQGCHAAARSYDFVCEGHAVATLGLSEETIRALQRDPRCPPGP